MSQAGFDGDLDSRMLSWGEEILRCHVETEEVPRGVAGARRPAGAYAGRLQRHVLPRFGARRLDEIGVDDILMLISDLRKRGYWDDDRRDVHLVLHACSRMRCAAA